MEADFVDTPRPAGASTNANNPRFTIDPVTNDISRRRGNTVGKWLDYVLTWQGGPRPEQARYAVRQYEHTSSFKLHVDPFALSTVTGNITTRDLSDHGAVIASLVFPFAPGAPPRPETVQLTFEARDAGSNSEIPEQRVRFGDEERKMPFTATVNKTDTVRVEFLERNDPAAVSRDRFLNWNSGSGTVLTIANPQSDGRFVAQFQREHLVQVVASPASAGSVSGGGWIKERSEVTLQASPTKVPLREFL